MALGWSGRIKRPTPQLSTVGRLTAHLVATRGIAGPARTIFWGPGSNGTANRLKVFDETFVLSNTAQVAVVQWIEGETGSKNWSDKSEFELSRRRRVF